MGFYAIFVNVYGVKISCFTLEGFQLFIGKAAQTVVIVFENACNSLPFQSVIILKYITLMKL